MAKPHIIVDSVSGVTPKPQALEGQPKLSTGFVTVSFEGGQSGFLDMASSRSAVWADVLASRREANEPVYVEIDPATNVITEVLLPLTVRVASINPSATKEAVEVELIISHAVHYLLRSNPDFQRLLDTLQSALKMGTAVLVTETLNDHEIIDVRPLPKGLAPAVTLMPFSADLRPMLSLITQQQAQQMFNLVNAKLCCPASAGAPCIPFLYPDDGCWGRAHEMCRIMIGAGVQPDKVWIYGRLRVGTANNPACEVRWGWHVAATLFVNTAAGAQMQVIDPSLFSGPVAQSTWVALQGDPAPAVEPSSALAFYRTKGGGYVESDDAAYSKTRGVLDRYRNELRLRSVGSAGPPPYIACLTKPAGVQWFGTINPSATQRWFTYGWPVGWHVFWTVMPLTLCPGAPQLSWSVQVERANPAQCTYWITVKNLTSDPVRFEGRYDILSR